MLITWIHILQKTFPIVRDPSLKTICASRLKNVSEEGGAMTLRSIPAAMSEPLYGIFYDGIEPSDRINSTHQEMHLIRYKELA